MKIEESVEPRDCPYVGLDYYHEKFGAWFFGREADGSKIITNLQAARLTLLHAEVGAGKSSLLRAGVAWRLRRLIRTAAPFGGEVDIPVVFSSWKDDPLLELVGAIGTAIDPYLAGRPKPELPADRLDAAIETASDRVNASLLIMLDQFEEYFLYCSREPTPERFADELARCINRADLPANFLIAIREDAYASLGDLFKGRIANVYGNYLHIDYLDRASAEEAIRAPLDVYNGLPGISEHVNIQDELVQAVLDQVRASDAVQGQAAAVNGARRVETPLLQLVMETIWEQECAEGSHELRLSTLQNLEGVEKIVDTHLGDALRALSEDERRTAIDTFDHLVTPSGGKIAESVPDLAQRTGHSEEQIGQVLEKLDHARIVRPVPAPPGQDPMRFRRYEIFHDVLAPPINRTITASEEQRRAHQLRLARRARRLRFFGALAVSLLIAASAVAVVFAYLLQTTILERSTSESRQLAAEADLNVAHNPELSALLALQALHLRYTSQADEALRTALPAVQAVRVFQDKTTVLSAAFDPADKNLVASVDLSGIAQIWDVKTRQRLLNMSLGGFNVTGSADSVAFNPAGTQVAVGYADGQVALFGTRSGKTLKSVTISSSPVVNDVQFVGNTGELAIATAQNLALWRPTQNGTCCWILSNQGANTIGADPGNPREFVAGTSSGAVIWTVSSSGRTRQQPLDRQDPVAANDAEFSPDGRAVVTAGSDGNVRVYDLVTSKAEMTLGAGEGDVSTAAFSPDGREIVAGYSSGTTRVWGVASRLQLALVAGNVGTIYAARFSADGSEVVTANADGTVRLWHAQPRELRTEFISPLADGTPSPIGGAYYISDRIIAFDKSGSLHVFTPDGRLQAVLNTGAHANTLDWNRAGTEVVTGDSNGNVELWRATGSNYTQISGSPLVNVGGSAAITALSPDASRVAIVAGNNQDVIQIQSARTGKQLQMLNAHNAIQTVTFSPSGRQIVAGDLFGQVEVWDAVARKPRVLGTPGSPIDDLQFNTSGSQFVTASKNAIVTIWDARDDRRVRSINACSSPYTARFSPDGSQIVVACGDGTAPVFDVSTGQELTVIQATSAGTITSATFSPDGKSIVTGIDAGTVGCVQVWNSELATPSLTGLERLARQRVTRQLTGAEQQEYLSGISP